MASIDDLEEGRLQLEQEVEEVSKMLQYWRNWETDYEILKEDITAARPRTSELLAAAMNDFQGKLLNKQEMQKILKTPADQFRSTKEVVDLLKHRLDYVKGNVDSLTKQQNTLVKQLGGDGAASSVEITDQDDFPLTEITEELDEEGNIVASSTSNPDTDLISKLEQKRSSKNIGKSDLPSPPLLPGEESARGPSRSAKAAKSAEIAAKKRAELLVSSLDNDDDVEDIGEEAFSAENATVSLLERIADVTDSGDSGLGPVLIRKPDADLKRTGILEGGSSADFKPILPDDDSPEDAALRMNMLNHSLNEVGAVVAEMDLEMGSGEEDTYEGLEELDSDELSEEEDEYGRAVNARIPESYKQEMEELERQLGAGRAKNIGPAPGRISPDSGDELSTAPSTVPQKRPSIAAPAKGALKKTDTGDSKLRGVRFAENVEVSTTSRQTAKEAMKTDLTAEADASNTAPEKNPLADMVLERSANPVALPSVTSSARKPSRFKAGRATRPDAGSFKSLPATRVRAEEFAGTLLDASESRPSMRDETPQGPPGVTHGDVVESESNSAPRPPGEVDDDDPIIQRRQLAAEYYEKRNAVIQAQGGFRAPDPVTIPVDENGEEVKPRVSRFKAARMRKDG